MTKFYGPFYGPLTLCQRLWDSIRGSPTARHPSFPTFARLAIFRLTQSSVDVLYTFMFTAATLATQDDADDPDQDRRAAGASGHIAGVLLVVRTLIDFGRQMLATVRNGGDRSAVAGIKLRFKTLDIAAIVARITQALALAAGLETRLEKLAARVPSESEADGSAERQPRSRAAKAANDGLPSAAAIAQRLRERPIGVVLAEICRELGIQPSDPIWQEAFLPILRYGGRPPFPTEAESERRWAAYPVLSTDPDVRAELERFSADYMPPSGAGPPWFAVEDRSEATTRGR